MRKSLVLLSALVLVIGISGLTYAAVAASLHDFRDNQPGADSTNINIAGGAAALTQKEICGSCHVPHKTLGVGDVMRQSLLWQQTVYQANPGSYNYWGTADFWYTYWKGQDEANVYADLDVGSRRCLGCHDGRSFNLWKTYAGRTSLTVSITQGAGLIVDLRQTHPVAVDYILGPTQAPLEFETKGTAEGKGIRFVAGGGGLGNLVGCGSCHDPHNGLSGAENKFVRVSMENSALCTACHKK